MQACVNTSAEPPIDETEVWPTDDTIWGSSKTLKKSQQKKKPLKKSSGWADYEGFEPAHPQVGPKMSKLRESFAARAYPLDSKGTEPSFEVVFNQDPKQDFTPVFVGHARLYLLGDEHLIDDLAFLALGKLHETLVGFTLHSGRFEDVTRLVRYVYDNAPQSPSDPLRVLVTEYIATKADTLGNSPEFRKLLEEGGDFVTEFWAVVHKQLL